MKSKINNEDYLKVVQRCKELRIKCKLTQKEFAHKYNISYSTICSFEQGLVYNLRILLSYLQLPDAVDWVFQDIKSR